MKFNIFNPNQNLDNYFVAKYFVKVKTNLKDAAWNLAIGQSIGNPSARSEFETEELFENHACIVLHTEESLIGLKEGIINIAFPEANINFETDGVTQLLVHVMGGQCDIDLFTSCKLLDIKFTDKMLKVFKGPKFGLSGMKSICKAEDRPLFGGIVKPKVGLSPDKLLDLVKKLIDGGCDFIKEDEILSDPAHCPINKRVPLVMDYIRSQGRNVFYAVCINADHSSILKRVEQVNSLGGNAIHVNFHSGLGVYKSIRGLDLPILMHFQKSGDRILSHGQHDFSISQSLIFKLVALSGCDTLHSGMIGGYLDVNELEMIGIANELVALNAVPALSCGMHPGLVDHIKSKLGHSNWMANVGGSLFSHPMGTFAGVKAMRQAVTNEHGEEYKVAIDKWGKR